MEKQSFYGFREKGGKKFQSFALEIVAGCQLKCGNCYRSPETAGGLMPDGFVREAIAAAAAAGFSESVLIGGEPTLHKGLPEFVRLSLELGLAPIICTNGIRLADEAFAEAVAQAGATIVIHGLLPMPRKEMDRHVGMKGYSEILKKAYANLDRLRGPRKITIVAEAVIIRPFLPYLLEFHAWCRSNGYIPFLEINRRGNDGRANGLSAPPEEVSSLFEELQAFDRRNFPELADPLLTPPAYGNKCTMSITGVHIKNFGKGDYGQVYSCCAQTVSHGNLRERPLEAILAGGTLAVFKDQDRWIAGPCRECHHYPVCRGGCRGEASLAFGCARASCPACWLIPEEVRGDASLMMPVTCAGCPLEDRGCRPKR